MDLVDVCALKLINERPACVVYFLSATFLDLPCSLVRLVLLFVTGLFFVVTVS